MFRLAAEEFNEERRAEFDSLGSGGRYAGKQKTYAFKLISESGIRVTAKILKVSRRIANTDLNPDKPKELSGFIKEICG